MSILTSDSNLLLSDSVFAEEKDEDVSTLIIQDCSDQDILEVSTSRLLLQKEMQKTIDSNRTQRSNPSDELHQPSLFYILLDHGIGFLLLLVACLQYLLITGIWLVERIYVFLTKLFQVIRFCWEKPQHAKELFITTIHLIKVSYDAGLWNVSDCYGIVTQQLGMMTRTPQTTPRAIREK